MAYLILCENKDTDKLHGHPAPLFSLQPFILQCRYILQAIEYRLNMTEKLFTGTLNKNQNKGNRIATLRIYTAQQKFSTGR